ncbi:MAG: 3-deoxy-D-manno-octulosonic acid transferase [Pirellulales bacterium]|nr:3-deoxy-D-manno-octulosonic acid transferase [Pirellulales bacterium]
MSGYFLNGIYILLLIALSPFLLLAAIRKGKYREGWAAKFLGHVTVRQGNQTCIWFHAVSVGEVQLLGSLIQRLHRDQPDWQCVISTTTKTGFALAHEKFPQHLVFYCPLDFTWSTTEAMKRVRPDLLVLSELELWPNLIRAASRHGAKVAVINGRISDKSFRGYRWIRPLVGRMLRRIDTIAVQNEQYADRFLKLGASSQTVNITGSIKFDGANTDRRNPKTESLRALAGLSDGDVVFLAGSTQRGEEAAAVEVFSQLADQFPQLHLVLVPRHPERFEEVARLLDASRQPWQRRTQLADRPLDPPNARILLVDTVGELGAWWGTANIGFVGGSLGSRGGQNMIEPAAYGVAVCFGPNTQNFRDVVQALLAHQAAMVVQDQQMLQKFVRDCLQDPQAATRQGQRAAELVASSRGATSKTTELLRMLIENESVTGETFRPAA